MHDCKPSNTLMDKGDIFSLKQCPKNEIEKMEIEIITYASVVRSLMYAQVCTCLNITYVVEMLDRYLSRPGLDHWKAVKRVAVFVKN